MATLLLLLILCGTCQAHFSHKVCAHKGLQRCDDSDNTKYRQKPLAASRRPSAFIDPTKWGNSFNEFAKAAPYAAASLTCGFNGVTADFIAQSSERMLRRKASANEESEAAAKDHMHNFRRSLAFLLYGCCYQGMTLHFIYNDLFYRIFGDGRAIEKTMVSQFIMAPCLTLPMAYMFKGLVFGKTIRGALEDYWIGVTQKGLLFAFWKLWIPIQLLVFTVIPVHLRIPFSSLFSFLWTVLLSRITNS